MNKNKRPKWLRIVLFTGLAGVVTVSAFFAYWSAAPPDQTCVSCHEIQASYDDWATSAHREVTCENCHGSALSSGWHSLQENAKRVVGHFAEEYHDDIRLSERQVLAMSEQCRTCHAGAYASWQGSGHAVTYATVFLDAAHNSIEPPNNDCLRCHGMFYEGGIESLLTPLDTSGPWTFLDEAQGAQAAIPCLACHQVHAPGHPAAGPESTVASAALPPGPSGMGFFDRRERMFFATEHLPALKLADGDRAVLVSQDFTQRLCIQCHAPNAAHQPGTGDDRTPRGVHEGLRCSSCHQPHTQDTRASCAGCHPALSNCDLDVETMNTTFLTSSSTNDIHFVACIDCHTERP